MKAIMAGADGCAVVGQEIELADAEAQSLVSAGYAEIVGGEDHAVFDSENGKRGAAGSRKRKGTSKNVAK